MKAKTTNPFSRDAQRSAHGRAFKSPTRPETLAAEVRHSGSERAGGMQTARSLMGARQPSTGATRAVAAHQPSRHVLPRPPRPAAATRRCKRTHRRDGSMRGNSLPRRTRRRSHSKYSGHLARRNTGRPERRAAARRARPRSLHTGNCRTQVASGQMLGSRDRRRGVAWTGR